MNKTDAIALIETIINSIERESGQFHIEVSVTGQKISSSGGIGAIISATGGEPGSTTIGQTISMGGSQIEFARKAATQEMQQQIQALLTSLKEIVVELSHRSPDKSRIQSILDSLKETWVPPLIVSLVAKAIASSIGL